VSFKAKWNRDKLAKKREKGFRGYPVATVAFYGPDDKRASKVSVGIIPAEGSDVAEVERWNSDTSDVRNDAGIVEAVLCFVELHGAKTIVGVDRIIGCPHEEGLDYPEGQACQKCSYWAGRDRWSGVVTQG